MKTKTVKLTTKQRAFLVELLEASIEGIDDQVIRDDRRLKKEIKETEALIATLKA